MPNRIVVSLQQSARRAGRVAVLGVAALSAIQCDKAPTEPGLVLTSNVVTPMNATIAEYLTGLPWVFSDGREPFGFAVLAGKQVSVVFSVSGTAPVATVSVTSGGTGSFVATITPAASATTPCSFAVTSSTVTGVTVGSTSTVAPCRLTIETIGLPVDGKEHTAPGHLDFGSAAASNASAGASLLRSPSDQRPSMLRASRAFIPPFTIPGCNFQPLAALREGPEGLGPEAQSGSGCGITAGGKTLGTASAATRTGGSGGL